MKKKIYRHFVGDFETTVYNGQDFTEVWASASVEINTEEVKIFHSLAEQFEYFVDLGSHLIVYYHNLKFDGSFWLPFLMVELGLKQAYEKIGDSETQVQWLKEFDMPSNSFKYSISDKGQWYNIIIKIGNIFIEIRDSYKLLPFSVKRIGKSFGTKHKKLDMEYKGFRYAGCEITKEEEVYISNDVLVVKEALEIMFEQDHKEITIGSCCLKEYKRIMGKEDYEMFYPDIYEMSLDESVYRYATAGDYVRKSYRGGWCYLVKGKENKRYTNGTTADVNSLYPSVMHSESGNRYPVGEPKFWKGDMIPEEALKPNRYYFVRIKTRFYLKPNKLPFIQIKSSFLYKGTECLETTDIYDDNTQQYYSHYKDKQGNLIPAKVELVLTMTDFKLLKEHYDLVDFEILDGCWFFSEIGLFDSYINKYREIKINSTGALRELAKLFLNNLYGKMASSKDSSFKLAFVKEDGSLGFIPVAEANKKPGYIPVGSAITSYARDFTIRTAQKNYYGKDKKGFIYADTDSIHCDIPAEQIKGITVHDSAFCCWKLESSWDYAIFTRQKTYIEHVVAESLEPVEPYYSIKCAGMPDKCKKLFELSITEPSEEVIKSYTEEEQEFIRDKKTLEDFTVGLRVMGKLHPKRIKGGIVLLDGEYQMR